MFVRTCFHCDVFSLELLGTHGVRALPATLADLAKYTALIGAVTL